jgi:hypothetical protein
MFVTVKARIHTDSTGACAELPVVLTPAGILEPLLDYYLSRSHDRSLAWMTKVTRSVRMFLEYLQSNPAERDTYRLFQNFAQRLYTGTFDRTTGLDPVACAGRHVHRKMLRTSSRISRIFLIGSGKFVLRLPL